MYYSPSVESSVVSDDFKMSEFRMRPRQPLVKQWPVVPPRILNVIQNWVKTRDYYSFATVRGAQRYKH